MAKQYLQEIGVEKTSRGVNRYLHGKFRNQDHPLLFLIHFLLRLRGIDQIIDQIMVRAVWQGMADSAVLNLGPL